MIPFPGKRYSPKIVVFFRRLPAVRPAPDRLHSIAERQIDPERTRWRQLHSQSGSVILFLRLQFGSFTNLSSQT